MVLYPRASQGNSIIKARLLQPPDMSVPKKLFPAKRKETVLVPLLCINFYFTKVNIYIHYVHLNMYVY